MEGANTFSRYLIVNGHPIFIKEDYSTDILQGIDEVTCANPISPVVSCNTEGQNISVVDDCSDRSEYVTVISNEQNTENSSTIRLTFEQAAELGLHFTVDQSIESNTNNKEENSNTAEHDQCITSNNRPNHTNVSKNIKLDTETCNSAQDVHLLSKNSGEKSYVDSFNPLVEETSNQQLALVPHIVNGTVTYTLQLSSQNLEQSSSNEFFRLNQSSIVTRNPNSAENELKLDLGDLATSSDLSFINSPVDIVSDKPVNSTNDSISNHAYGFVSCNSENVTFLSLSNALPVSSNSIVTHIRPNDTITQQSNLAKDLCCSAETVTKRKVFITQERESLLFKEDNYQSSLNGIIHPRTFKTTDKGKVNEEANFKDHSSEMSVTTMESESSSCQLNVCVEQTSRGECSLEFTTTVGNSEASEKTDLRTSKNNFVTSVSSLVGSDGCKRTEDSCNAIKGQTPTVITPRGGDVPKEVSVALSRIPIKADSNKPLGSSENPIQLVQQGSTFHSMQALTEDHISKIKPILQENFDTKVPSKNVVYDPSSNTRIIYRIISPAEVSLRKNEDYPRRRGRPKKVRSIGNQLEEGGEGAPPPKKMFPRTRSGRLSRPPKHMVRDYKHIRRAELDDSDGAYSDYQSEHEDDLVPNFNSAPVDLLPGLVAKRKNHKRNISAGNLCPTCGKIYLGYVRMKRHFDKYPDHGSIEYLNTIRNSHPDSEAENHRVEGSNGLWKKGSGRRKGRGKSNLFTTTDKRTRLKEALEWCQSKEVAEIAGPKVASVLSLWELLLLRVDSVKQDSRVATLYSELCQLLYKLRQMAHRLFRPLNHPLSPDTKHVTVQVEDELMTGLLNLPCGVYLASDEDLNESSISTDQNLPIQESQITLPPTSLIEKKSQEENVPISKSKIDIDQAPQTFLLTNEEMICDTDDRGLVNVDEIVSERLQNFTESQSSSVDELMKGLNELDQRNKLDTDDLMDGFSIVSRRSHVSASTEDLMKSLEHFDSDINHSDPPNTLDRDTFDRVSNVDTLDFDVLSREFHSNNR